MSAILRIACSLLLAAWLAAGLAGSAAAEEALRFVQITATHLGDRDHLERTRRLVAELNRLWTDLEYKPRAWIFGHFHQDRETRVEDTRFVCLGHRLTLDRAVVWDTETGDLVC